MSEKERTEESARPQKVTSPQNEGQFSSGVELLSKALKTVFVILAVAIISVLAWFVTCGGSFIVDSTSEAVVVLKFGEYAGEYREGWHWFMPYPVNRIIRIPTIKQEVRSSMFLPTGAEQLYDNKQSGRSAGTLIPGIDGYTLLGDNSIMHSEWIMTYRVSDPSKYFLNCVSKETLVAEDNGGMAGGPDAEDISLNTASLMLKSLLDDAVITTSATLDVSKTYYDKALYETAVKTALENRIREMDIGVTMENLTLKIVAPPVRTLKSFQELLLAKANAETEIQEAGTYSIEQHNLALRESASIDADAQAYRTQVVTEVDADAKYFLEILPQYRKNPDATIVSLYSAALGEAVVGVKDKYIVNTTDGNDQEVRVKINQENLVKRVGASGGEAGDAEKDGAK